MPKITTEKAERLRLPQLRVLAALAARGPMVRDRLKEACGFAPIAGTLTTALNGIREGSSSGTAHKGLLALGLVEDVAVDVDGLAERLLTLTPAGRLALEGDPRAASLPRARDRATSTNKRYLSPSSSAGRATSVPASEDSTSGPNRALS